MARKTTPTPAPVAPKEPWTPGEIDKWTRDRITHKADACRATIAKYHTALAESGLAGSLTWHLMPALSAEYFLNYRINGLVALQNLLDHPVDEEGGSNPVAVLGVFVADLTKRLLEWEMLGHSTSEIGVWHSRVQHDTALEMRQFYAELVLEAELMARP